MPSGLGFVQRSRPHPILSDEAIWEYHNVSFPDDRRPGAGTVADEEEPDQGSASHIAAGLGPQTEVEAEPAGVMRAGEAGSMPNHDNTAWVIDVGSDVIGQCGHKVGEVVAVRDDVIVVEKGFFMPVDFYIPKSAIERNNDHGLYLNVTKNEALHRGWDKDPRLARAS